MCKQFGDILKELRLKKEMTQQELAKVLNTGKASISHYESNRRIPDVTVIEKLADYFGVSIDYLMGRTDNKNKTIEPEKNLHPDNVQYKTIKEIIDTLKKRLVEEGIIKEDEPISEEMLNMITTYGKEAAIEIIKSREKQDS